MFMSRLLNGPTVPTAPTAQRQPSQGASGLHWIHAKSTTAAMAGDGAAGGKAVEAWVAPRRAKVDRIRMSVHEIANSGLTLSKLSVAASLLGDLVKN